MKFECINPSDKIYCESDDLLSLGIVALIFKGQYPFEEIDGEKKVPLFMFGGGEEWLKENGEDINNNGLIERNSEGVIKCLESFKLASGDRTSMNDICGYAHKYAQHLRK